MSTNSPGLTTDPNDPDLGYGGNSSPVPQNKKYLILSEDERKKGFVRPVRQVYKHLKCQKETRMGLELSETYAVRPKFYLYTYCCHCMKHLPVDEFIWVNTEEKVGS